MQQTYIILKIVQTKKIFNREKYLTHLFIHIIFNTNGQKIDF